MNKLKEYSKSDKPSKFFLLSRSVGAFLLGLLWKKMEMKRRM